MLRPLCWLTAFALPTGASACMMCDTALGDQIRQGVFDGHFVSTAFAVLLPFPLFLMAGAAIHFGVPILMTPKQPSKTTRKE